MPRKSFENRFGDPRAFTAQGETGAGKPKERNVPASPSQGSGAKSAKSFEGLSDIFDAIPQSDAPEATVQQATDTEDVPEEQTMWMRDNPAEIYGGVTPEERPVQEPVKAVEITPYSEAAQTSPELEKILRGMGLSSTNESFFKKMTSGARNTFSSVRERVKKAPGATMERLNRIPVIGNMAISMNQGWIEKHTEKEQAITEGIAEIDKHITAIDQGHAELTQILLGKSESDTGTPELKAQLKQLESQKTALIKAREDARAQFEKHQKKIEIYTEHRDKIIARFEEKYAEKIAPLREEATKFRGEFADVELIEAGMKVKHDQLEKESKELESERDQIVKALVGTGLEKADVMRLPAIQPFEAEIEKNRSKIEDEQASIAKTKENIRARTSQVKERIKGYEETINAYNEIKNGATTVEAPKDRVENTPPTGTSVSFEGTESTEDKIEFRKIESYIRVWNDFIDEMDDEYTELSLSTEGADDDATKLYESTFLHPTDTASAEHFKDILNSYFRKKGLHFQLESDSEDFADFQKMLEVTDEAD